MRVLHISQSDCRGGAAIAARRLVQAQRDAGVDAHMLVLDRSGREDWVHEYAGPVRRIRIRAERFAAKRLCRILSHHDRQAMRTLALFDAGLGPHVAALRPDVVHLHWLGAESAGLGDMAMVGTKARNGDGGQAAAPVVWTCHDEWAFGGAAHYDGSDEYRHAFRARPFHDPDRWTMRRKMRKWQGWRPTLIAPSRWMAERAAQSPVARDWPVLVIPNTLPFDRFATQPRERARETLGLNPDGYYLLSGAIGGTGDPRKGFDLLAAALELLPPELKARTTLLGFGGAKATSLVNGVTHHAFGPVGDERALATIYNAADVFILPSRLDNLPNTLLEAQACGTPCLAFDVGGVRDALPAPESALVPAFQIDAMARAIVAQYSGIGDVDRARLRGHAQARFGGETVTAQHRSLYEELIRTKGGEE